MLNIERYFDIGFLKKYSLLFQRGCGVGDALVAALGRAAQAAPPALAVEALASLAAVLPAALLFPAVRFLLLTL